MHRRRGPFGPPFGPSGDGPAGCGPFARRGYHHGRLREALMDAARRLLGERGLSGFTLGDAAKLAGVSAAAPYRHFRDRDALLGEVAAEGFRQFRQVLAGALDSNPDPERGLEAMGRAYLAFAREEPGVYAAMFDRPAPTAGTGDAGPEPGGSAFGVLVSGIGRVLAARGLSVRDEQGLALQVWALAHGVASLCRSGQLGPGPKAPPEDVLLHGARAILGLAERG